ncbi:[protein release factor]-glutamine N5-methyltransferase [Pacificibacter maritimus]|uniref:Release factor glutamine methyltransferase n=1 Tax=Pacificibacter maritimus TaxID=762213 RepID=A0A3N4VFD1_9RHOB|nr:peptide chain release factor N(5)-glutamine methyltransferase [Pacificibacter maritimus]RPE71624.1 [protein release factor]-glutamine N5-methyltransferase [Pacificibacter maritimus]
MPCDVSGVQTVQQALIAAARQLEAAGIQGGARDARLIMAHILQLDPSRITLVAHDPLASQAHSQFCTLIARRVAREPVSHLLGRRQFYGRDFHVTPDVLDPRPETETLIFHALQRPFASVLDMGTGSGAIILTLLAENPLAKGQGSDLSQPALKIAQANADLLGLSKRVQFTQSNWFDNLDGTFDLIVSNPPYIALNEMAGLAPELSHEPRLALTDEADGLTAYRHIAAEAARYLNSHGRLMFEIGPSQGQAVADMLLNAGFKAVRVIADMDGRDRVVTGIAL